MLTAKAVESPTAYVLGAGEKFGFRQKSQNKHVLIAPWRTVSNLFLTSVEESNSIRRGALRELDYTLVTNTKRQLALCCSSYGWPCS